MLAEETRPRVFHGKRGVVCILRGINMNPNSDPEDMVAMRIWSDGKKIITVRQRRLITPRDVLGQLLTEETGPRTVSELFERLIARMIDRMSGTVSSFEEQIDDLETHLDISNAAKLRRKISDIGQNAVSLRKYMAPQREALTSLLVEPPLWLEEYSKMNLRDTTDRLVKYIEELETAREKLLVIKDDITNQIAESSNKTLYMLAILSGIFLPFAFLTGLLGINIGGMPGVDSPYAFWIFCFSMIVMLVFEIILFRKLKWL